MSQFLRNTFIWLFIAGATFFALQNFNQGPSSENMTYSEFVSLVNKDQIASVSFQGDGYTINGFKDDGTPFSTTRPIYVCLLYTSPSPRDAIPSRMPSSA